MTSPHSRPTLRRSLILGLASLVGAVVLHTPPAAAEEPDDSDCAPAEAGLQERNEAAALALAVECGAEVLIRDAQDYTSRSFAQPDGSVMSEFSAIPAWVPDAAGEWVDADPTVEVAADGSLSAAATVSELEFGAAGETAFVTATRADGERVALEWVDPLPEPVVDGSTVTYPEVLPEVDLEVYAGVADFSYALVVKTPEAAANPELERVELGLDVEGLTVAHDATTDTAVLTDASGDVAYSVAQPRMWDSADTETGESEQVAPMPLEMDADSLTVVPDQEILADPATEFPVYIDPEFTDETASAEEVFSQETGISCGTSNELCVGAQLWQADGALGYWRSALQFTGLDSIANRDVQQTNVWITQTHTGDAGGPNQTVRLYSMDYFDTSGSVSWSTFNDKLNGLLATDSVPTSNSGAGESEQRITWEDSRTADRVQYLVDRGGNTVTFGIVSGANSDQEGDRGYFRKLAVSSAKMTVWHGPSKPTNLLTDGEQCSTSAPGDTINTLTPTFTATAPPALKSTNMLKFYVYERSGVPDNHLEKIEISGVSSGETVTVSVPSGVLERGKTYRWNSRIKDTDPDSTRYSEFTNYCYFTVNSLPTTPSDTSTGGLGCGTQAAPTVMTTRAPKLSAMPADPDGGALELEYHLYTGAGAGLGSWTSDEMSGTISNTTVPSGEITADGLYKWRVRASDAFATSALSAYCWFTVDTTAPEPPDVVQRTANPLPGGTVSFDFVGGPDVQSFEYSFNDGAVDTVSATTGSAGIGITLPDTGSIDHKLEVWARDFPIGGTGNTSSKTTYLFTAIEVQPAEALGAWRFDGDTLDDASADDLTAVSTALFGPDAAGRSDAAAVFDGTEASCLRAEGPIVNTVESATFAAWVRVDEVAPAGHTLLNVSGEFRSNLKLSVTADARARFATASADTEEASVWTKAQSPTGSIPYGTWTHVAGVYDASAERLRLYIDGDLQASVQLANEPWAASGLLSVGCGAMTGGGTFGWTTGSIDEITVFQQALTGEQIQDLMGGEGLPPALQAWYPLRGDGLDESGRGADLTAMPATPTWVVDQHGRADSALNFDGTICPTAGTVPVRTDSAFTVSAWARLDADNMEEHPRVFSFNGTQALSVMAKYDAVADKWKVGVTSDDSAAPTWGEGAVSAEVATQEEWTQITVTVDPDNDLLQLFVNGALSDTGTIAPDWDPWRAGEFVIGCDGRTDGTRWSEWNGAISDVRVWRGALNAAEAAAVHTERLSHWELGQDPATLGLDQWGANDLTFNGEYSWVTDRWNDCWAAYGLDLAGAGYASTANSVFRTDESFTVAAWARLDDTDDYRTVVSQTGGAYGAFNLSYNPLVGGFQFSMPQNDEGTGIWARAVDQTAPEIGRWYHLTGQVDLGAGAIRLYVNGELVDETPVVDSPWQATGPLTIGAAEQEGVMTNQMVGSIDQVYAWAGAVDTLEIGRLAAERPDYELDEDNPDCEGSTGPPDPGDL